LLDVFYLFKEDFEKKLSREAIFFVFLHQKGCEREQPCQKIN